MISIDRISTSTNILCFKRNGRREMVSSIPLIAKAGYKNIDLNFCELLNPDNNIDDEYIGRLLSYKEEYSLNYNQSHLPYANDYLSLSNDDRECLDRLIYRSFDYSRKLGVDTIVIHPIKGSISDNITYFKRVLERLDDNSRLAIENMDREDEIARAEQLIEIIDSLNDKRVGICLDTGHAHLYGLSLEDEIKKMKNYLISTHIADNNQNRDEHFMPFFGTIEWENVIKALNDIDYKGYLTYEIMYFFKYVPEELQIDLLEYSLKTLKYLASMQ